MKSIILIFNWIKKGKYKDKGEHLNRDLTNYN